MTLVFRFTFYSISRLQKSCHQPETRDSWGWWWTTIDSVWTSIFLTCRKSKPAYVKTNWAIQQTVLFQSKPVTVIAWSVKAFITVQTVRRFMRSLDISQWNLFYGFMEFGDVLPAIPSASHTLCCGVRWQVNMNTAPFRWCEPAGERRFWNSSAFSRCRCGSRFRYRQK